MTTLAGGTERGSVDGVGKAARFKGIMGLAFDGGGNIIAVEYGGHRIRKVTPRDEVTTIAGTGKRGSRDGPAMQATFGEAAGVAVGPRRAIYVLENSRMRVRKISPDGTVTTIANVSR